MERTPAYEGREPYIFVSYAHKDSAAVLPVIRKLYEEKYRVWYDEGITPGSEWPHNIATHIENADTVAIFTSANSLASINCENEVVRAKELHKNIVAYNIDSRHELLGEYPNVENSEDLIAALDKRLIGDGITGYERVNEKGKRSQLWNIILAFSILLGLGLAGVLYGVNKGYFDEYLPGRIQIEVPTEQPVEEGIDVIDNDILAQAILTQLGKDDLMKEVEFSDEDTFIRFCKIFGYDYVDSHITYFDLTNDHRKEVYMENPTEEMLKLLKYYPELESVTIDEGNIKSLEPLNECPYLKQVIVSYNLLPIKIPENARFEVIVE